MKIKKSILLMMLLLGSLSYGEEKMKLRAEISERENNLLIKISEDEKKIKKVEKIEINDDTEITHIVKAGDTLSHIALRYKKSVKKMVIKKIGNDNAIKNVDLIYPGEILIIK